jgi:hypothetical protein
MPEPTTTVTPVTDEREAFVEQFDQPAAATVATAPAAAAPAVEVATAAAIPAGEKFLHPLRASEVVFGVTTIFLWLCFFLVGIVVETESLRTAVAENAIATTGEWVGVWIILLTCYTVTNIAILSCCAGVIGKFSRRSLSYETASLHGLKPAPIAAFREVLVLYAVAIARGFVIYLLLTGGLILLTTPVVTNSSPEEYIKIAGTVSILAFLAGYDAEIFKRALDRVSAFSSEGKGKS